MATLYTEKSKNIWKTWLYITIFCLFVIGIGYIFSYVMNSYSILVIAVLLAILMSFGSYWWSDKLVLAMNKAVLVSHENNRALYHLVENLCITAGLPVPKIYIIEDLAMNAFATGRDPDHAVICVTRGLLEKLDKMELEGVLAHELSHVGNRDILLSTVIVILVGIITLLSDLFRHFTWFGGGKRDNDNSQLAGILTIVALILSLLAPLAAILIQLAISRKREFLADASGALLTRYPEGLASALQKISGDPNPLRSANHATAHLFISNPFKKSGFINRIFSTHPPIEERVKALIQMDVENEKFKNKNEK
ncbi:MAG: M48 family metallopeptidase [Patescibacteria group bacterium]|nr:M48 family metallopeptidase [Patescibacteria group bacterium]